MTTPGPESLAADGAPALVGRDRERATLRAALTAALAGRGSLVLVGGEAGLGKTTLIKALARETAGRATVLIGHCYDLADTPPYGPWTEILRAVPDAESLPPLPPPFRPGMGMEGVASQAALFAQVWAFVAAAAGRSPLLVLLDDLHWADPASLDLLRFLARQVDKLPVLVISTYRPDELTRQHPLYATLPLLVREAGATRLDLRPLDDGAVRALVDARYRLAAGDRERLVAWLRRRAEGNPFFTGELLRTLEEERTLRPGDGTWHLDNLTQVRVPSLLRQVIDGRVDRLGEEARQLLAVAATIGQEPPLDLWGAVAGVDEEMFLGAIEAAAEARVLVVAEDGTRARFAHALIREALYEGVLPTRRRAWHRRIAERLAAQPAADPDAVAYHFRQAGDPRAAEWLIQAGERAQHTYAWLTAAERYEAALALLEAGGADTAARGWLLFRLATVRRFADPRQALGDAEEATRLAREADDSLLAGMATFLAGLLLGGYLGSLGRGVHRMEAGLASLVALPTGARVPPGAAAPIDPVPRRGTVVAHLAWSGRYADALALGERYLADVAPLTSIDWLGGNPYADAHSGLGEAYMAVGQPGRARAAYARCRTLNHAVGHHVMAAFAGERELEVVLRYQANRPDERHRLLTELTAAMARTRGVYGVALPAAQVPHVLALTGDWVEARRTAEGTRRTLAPGFFTYGVASATLGVLDRAQGDAIGAGALVMEALPEGPDARPGDGYYAIGLSMQRLAAALALDAGDLPTARAWLAAHDRWLTWSGAVLGRAEGHLGWAAYHRAAGDPVVARQQAEQALAHATEPRQPLALLAAHRLLGELDTAAGRHADARPHLDAALALAAACAAPYERALTLLALTDLRLATGDRDGAEAALNEARAILVPFDARPALARADALAAQLAATPPPRDALPAGLTAREAEVLQLVAQGLTNAQVAERLFLSPRTVDRHLNAVYTKLGVASRAAATRFAVEHGLG